MKTLFLTMALVGLSTAGAFACGANKTSASAETMKPITTASADTAAPLLPQSRAGDAPVATR